MVEFLVLAREQLVLGDGGAAAGAPDRGAVPLVEPASLVRDLEEAPDVLDVRVREGVVVVVPVHPHAEPLRLLGDHLGEAGDPLLAARGELGDPVLLDLSFRVQPQGLLDLDLDPQALAVEPVLVALVEASKRLVALKHVLERPAPGVMDAHRVVRRDRAVDEAEALRATILLPEAVEDALFLPPRQHRSLERRVIRLVGERLEGAGHRSILERAGNTDRSPAVYPVMTVETERNEMTAVVTQTTFEEKVLQSDKPVLVDFWAEWCGPCHAVAPILDKIVQERVGDIQLFKVNIDEEHELAHRYGVMSIPTMILFRDGEPAAVAIGAQ